MRCSRISPVSGVMAIRLPQISFRSKAGYATPPPPGKTLPEAENRGRRFEETAALLRALKYMETR